MNKFEYAFEYAYIQNNCCPQNGKWKIWEYYLEMTHIWDKCVDSKGLHNVENVLSLSGEVGDVLHNPLVLKRLGGETNVVALKDDQERFIEGVNRSKLIIKIL